MCFSVTEQNHIKRSRLKQLVRFQHHLNADALLHYSICLIIGKLSIAILDVSENTREIIEKLLISKNVPPISSDKLNWKHCSKNKKESVSYPRRIWNCLWKQCTKLRGNTRRTSWIVIDAHSFHSDLCETWPLWNDRTLRDFTPFCRKT